MSGRELKTKARALFTAHRAFFIIFLIGLLIRAFVLARAGEFGWDELFSFTFSQLPWKDGWQYWLAETNPPLHMILLKIWFMTLPATELTARILSLFFGLLALGIFYLFALQTTSKRNANLALLFLAVAYNSNIASALARGYALLIFLSLVSNYLFLRIYYFKITNHWLKIVFTITQFLLLFTHYTGVYNLLAQFTFLTIMDRNNLWRYIKQQLAPITLWLVWAIPSLSLKIASDTFGAAWFMRLGHIPLIAKLCSFTSLLFPFFTNFYFNWAIVQCIILILFLIGFIWQIKRMVKHPQSITWFNYLYITIVMVLVILAQLWNIKFLIIMLPYLLIVNSELINLIQFKIIKITLVFIIIIVNLALIIQRPTIRYWIDTVDFINQQTVPNTKQIIVGNNIVDKLSLDYTYHGSLPSIFYSDFNLASPYEEMVRYNYVFYLREDWEIKNWYRKNQLDKFKEIFLIQQNTAGIEIGKILEQAGWHLKQTVTIDPSPKKYLYWYEKN